MNADQRVIDMTAGQLKDMIESFGDAKRVMEIVNTVYVGTKVAAESIGVTPKTICDWRRSGKIKCGKYGKIPVSEIVRIVQQTAA